MRIAVALLVMVLAVPPASGASDTPDISPAPTTDPDEARWAEWEAQSRITDGDYDGAVQAHQQADAERRDAERRDVERREAGARGPQR